MSFMPVLTCQKVPAVTTKCSIDRSHVYGMERRCEKHAAGELFQNFDLFVPIKPEGTDCVVFRGTWHQVKIFINPLLPNGNIPSRSAKILI